MVLKMLLAPVLLDPPLTADAKSWMFGSWPDVEAFVKSAAR